MSTMPIYFNWNDHGQSFRLDIMCLIVALAVHSPLLFVKLDMKKRSVDRPKARLVSVDLIDPSKPKPVVPPTPVKKEKSIFEKLKALVKKEPPPPPKPVKKAPAKLLEPPKEIKLQAKLKTAGPSAAKLKSKSGFKTAADPTLVQKKKLSLKSMSPGIAPLSSKKLGVLENRAKLKSNKGNFKMAQSETLSGIGGSGPGIADASAPTIAIQTGKKGSVEKFSAAPPQKKNKGSFKGAGVSGLGDKKLSLRDRIIARDAAPSQIGGTSSSPARRPTLTGAVATKRDAGRSFDADTRGSLGAVNTGSNQLAKATPKIPAIQPRKKKKSMFVITGPLKERQILKKVLPEYPAWAQAKGIEAAVVLEFTVEPDGNVKENIVVRRTSGYPKLDETAIRALRKWRFVALPLDQNREEVGLITLNYSLS